MIVEPDFLEHHKTLALVELAGSEAAPLALLRLWGYCQKSRRWEFPEMSEAQLTALCRWRFKRISCAEALIQAGYLRRIGKRVGFAAHEWEVRNAQLIQKWNVGAKSKGRPKKGSEKGVKTDEENNRTETGRLSDDNRTKTDQTRLDQIRSDVPKSNSGGTGEMQEGGAPSAQSAEGDGAFVVPRFEPVPKGVFRRELENDVVLARRFIAEVKARDDAWVWGERERKDYAESVQWYRDEMAKEPAPLRLEKLTKQLAELESKRMEKFKMSLKPEAKAVCEAWTARIKELELAMAGARV